MAPESSGARAPMVWASESWGVGSQRPPLHPWTTDD